MDVCFVWLPRKCGEIERNWQVWIVEYMLGMVWSSCCMLELIVLRLVSMRIGSEKLTSTCSNYVRVVFFEYEGSEFHLGFAVHCFFFFFFEFCVVYVCMLILVICLGRNKVWFFWLLRKCGEMQRNWQIWIVEYMLGMVWSSCCILELIVLYLVLMRIGFWEVHKHTFKFYMCFIFKCEGVEFSFRVCFWNLSSASLFFILYFVFFMCVCWFWLYAWQRKWTYALSGYWENVEKWKETGKFEF